VKIFKRGGIYWFQLAVDGKRYKKNTLCSNRSDAVRVANSERSKMLMALEGIDAEKVSCPTLREFRSHFLAGMNGTSATIRTRQTLNYNFSKLLEYTPLAEKPVSDINEVDIAGFVQILRSKDLSNATINRYISFLRSVLRFAQKMNFIESVPATRMLKAERRFPYVFKEDDCRKWLECSPEPLRSMSILARHTGMRVGEMLVLQKDNVALQDQPDESGSFGEIFVNGAKRPRLVKLARQVRDMLHSRITESKCRHVFTSPKAPEKALTISSLRRQITAVKELGDFPTGAGLQALRVTFVLELCRFADPFTIAKIAGHGFPTTMLPMPDLRMTWQAPGNLIGCTKMETGLQAETKPRSKDAETPNGKPVTRLLRSRSMKKRSE
jgi:site-specific recombinase XerD